MPKRKGPKHDQVLRTTNEKTYTDIVSQDSETRKRKRLEREVEKILGYKIDQDQYEEAYMYARHKLDWQRKHLKQSYDEKYTAKVISETYEQQIFANYINTVSIGRMKA